MTPYFDYDTQKEGNLSPSLDAATKFVNSWADENRSPFIIRSSWKGNEKANGRIQFQCPHGVDRDSRSKGTRPLQHVLYTNCPVMINVVQSRKENVWRVTKLIKKHEGHMLGPEVYGTYQKVRKLQPKDLQEIASLDGVGASRRRVASTLSDKTGIVINIFRK